MPARFRRIIHQQAQVSSFKTFYGKPESLTIVPLSKYIEQATAAIISMVFTELLLENALAIRPCNCEVASEPLLPKVARFIPVLSLRYKGKCAARVLKRSDLYRRMQSPRPDGKPDRREIRKPVSNYYLLTRCKGRALKY